MSERDVFRAALIAAPLAGVLCALAYLQIEHGTGIGGGTALASWPSRIELAVSSLLMAACYGAPFGLFCGIIPTIVAVAVWPGLESRLGTAGAIGALSVMIAVIGGSEVALSGGSGQDWPWAAGAGVVCGFTSAGALWLVKVARA